LKVEHHFASDDEFIIFPLIFEVDFSIELDNFLNAVVAISGSDFLDICISSSLMICE